MLAVGFQALCLIAMSLVTMFWTNMQRKIQSSNATS
ncbi:hypothetical protein F442_20938 [Phytophthora nicotianae P10297]|uniref:Uncharacterized protein n=2 Tax=Phytophthora nicotianae TaxID=4792 RepID=W2Y4T4_PHYNI|nr:hypothetical protein L915_20536 [Phytophthora nicotianae]ETP30011.1 hypothetical protein F442_20938 [Phytophthora nicotianae P10297]